jgi:hypothetical protein
MRYTLMVVVIALFAVTQARSHELHQANGESVNYSNWVNKSGAGCCNNQDCRILKTAELRTTPRLEINVSGKWCPVLTHHYLKTGNAPDGSSNHACIAHPMVDDHSGEAYDPDPCSRLLCFQPESMY